MKTKLCNLPSTVIWSKIDPQDIVCLRAESNYTFLFLKNDQKITLAICLKELEKQLAMTPGTHYLRVHKSVLINVQFITQIDWHVAYPSIILANKYEVPIARRKRMQMQKQIQSIDLQHINK